MSWYPVQKRNHILHKITILPRSSPKKHSRNQPRPTAHAAFPSCFSKWIMFSLIGGRLSCSATKLFLSTSCATSIHPLGSLTRLTTAAGADTSRAVLSGPRIAPRPCPKVRNRCTCGASSPSRNTTSSPYPSAACCCCCCCCCCCWCC